jgi:transitional endoplasmic reticulum ATPase
MAHFEDALDEVVPSVTDEVRDRYDEIEKRFNTPSVEEEDEQVPRTFQ